MSLGSAALVASKIASKAGGAAAAANAAKLVQPGFRTFVKEELANAIMPAALGTLYYAPQYFDPQDPLGSAAKIGGLIATDVAGSAAIAAGLRKAVGVVKPGTTIRAANPEYETNLNQLGLKLGASADEIDAGKKLKLKEIAASSKDFNIKAAEAAQAKRTAETLLNMKGPDYYVDTVKPSGLGNALAHVGNVGFSLYGMPHLVEQPLVQAGVLTPGYLRETENAMGVEPQINTGMTPQSTIISQQLQNRAEQNNSEGALPNTVLSLDTMSQLTALEVERLKNDLLAQAFEERDDLMVA